MYGTVQLAQNLSKNMSPAYIMAITPPKNGSGFKPSEKAYGAVLGGLLHF